MPDLRVDHLHTYAELTDALDRPAGAGGQPAPRALASVGTVFPIVTRHQRARTCRTEVTLS